MDPEYNEEFDMFLYEKLDMINYQHYEPGCLLPHMQHIIKRIFCYCVHRVLH